MAKDSIFVKASTIVMIGFSLMGIIGSYYSPRSLQMLIILCGAGCLLVMVYDRFAELTENTLMLKRLREDLLLEKRFIRIEKEISEQKGIISMMNKKGETSQVVIGVMIVLIFLYMVYIVFFQQSP